MINKYGIAVLLLLFLCIDYAFANEPFTRYIGGIIGASRNVETCTYNETDNTLTYRTYNGKESTVSCWWHPETEEGRINIESSVLNQLKQTDYVMIGYGQSASNPQFFYFIPSSSLSGRMNLNTMKRYLLSHPIINIVYL